MLRAEILRQRDFPTEQAESFMRAAFSALGTLPANYIPPERVESLVDIAVYHRISDHDDLAIRAGLAAVKAAALGANRGLEIRARMVYGGTLKDQYDFPASMTELSLAVELARLEGDAIAEGRALNNLAGWYFAAGLCAEALAIYEKLVVFWQANNEELGKRMALRNAATAALRLGDFALGIAYIERADSVPAYKERTVAERLGYVQGALTRCQLLIQVGRAHEAVAVAQTARKLAKRSGSPSAKALATLAEAISAYATGAAGSNAIYRVITRARGDTASALDLALDAAIRTFEQVGQFDSALALQRELLQARAKQKFDAVRRTLGRSSTEETGGATKLARLGSAVDRTVTDLTNASITQALRAGYDHARIFRVGRMAQLFSLSEGWPPERAQSLSLAAKLIDVGNMAVSDDLLRKSRALSDGERKLVSEHAALGAKLLFSTRLALLESCVAVVRFHHERWDGTGPGLLKGNAIPVEARTVALCDSFDALIHARPWRLAFSAQSALRILEEEAGSHFDPALTARFIAWAQAETRNVHDLEAHLSDEAEENTFVRTRLRVQQLVQSRP